MARILVADDDSGLREFMVDALERAGHEVVEATDGQDAFQKLQASAFHVLVTDLKMPRLDGLGLLKQIKVQQPELEVLILTAHGAVNSAVEAMRHGAFDYLQKPLSSPEELRMLVARAAEHRALRDRADATPAQDTPRLTWGSAAMARVETALTRVARTDATVLLLGETGVGKEVCAHFVHAASQRSAGPFVAINCAGLQDSLLESELFGHEKGAFTGAIQQRRGKLELADGGTFFLDEVGELKLDIQARLLRVLQEKRFERVGGNRILTTDIRLVAATNRDLQAMVQEGRFREDLYHRLNVFPVHIPPLRERQEDILPLAQHLLQGIRRSLGMPRLDMDPAFQQALLSSPWRGNVRELANHLERCAILADDGLLRGTPATSAPTPPPSVTAQPAQLPSSGGPVQTLEQLELDAIRDALTRFGGNRKLTADALGIGLRTLYEKLKKLDIL